MSLHKTALSKYLILFLFFIFVSEKSIACSMYKITLGTKTMVGCNEDAWRLTSAIWFETSKADSPY